jgi:capsular polysaccharide biosynthesis protein
MELRRYLSIARRRALLIIAIVVAAVLAGWFVTPRAKTYTATSTLYVGSRSISVDPRSGQVSASYAAGIDRLIQTFNSIIGTTPVADAGIKAADVSRQPSAVAAATKAAQIPNTNLIRVSVTDRDPAAARALANAVSTAFVERIQTFEPRDAQNPDQVVSVYQKASLPSAPNPSSLARNLALAGLLGLLVAAGVVALLEHLDISIRSSDDVERYLELPVLGVVPSLGDELPVTQASRIRTLKPSRGAKAPRGARVG